MEIRRFAMLKLDIVSTIELLLISQMVTCRTDFDLCERYIYQSQDVARDFQPGVNGYIFHSP